MKASFSSLSRRTRTRSRHSDTLEEHGLAQGTGTRKGQRKRSLSRHLTVTVTTRNTVSKQVVDV